MNKKSTQNLSRDPELASPQTASLPKVEYFDIDTTAKLLGRTKRWVSTHLAQIGGEDYYKPGTHFSQTRIRAERVLDLQRTIPDPAQFTKVVRPYRHPAPSDQELIEQYGSKNVQIWAGEFWVKTSVLQQTK